MPPNFDDDERAAAQRLIDAALREDLGDAGDVTSRALIPADADGRMRLVLRQPGVLAGGPVAAMTFATLDPAICWTTHLADGAFADAGTVAAEVAGPLRSLLTGERTALNFLTLLGGVATLTRSFVEAVAGSGATILDTRKTFPGYRVLQKYAVRAGGGTNHRRGLYDGVLVKDNHLAAWRESGGRRAEGGGPENGLAALVRHVRGQIASGTTVEVEVDTLDQLQGVLVGGPDIVLLDNMDVGTLRQAVALRDAAAPNVLLEASGGVTLETVAAIAHTGVDRISVGALTHSPPALDLAFDWEGA